MFMTMKGSRRTIPAGEFKAKCLKMLDRVAETKEVLVVTKRGKPVAKVVPLDEGVSADLHGSVTFLKDIVAPIEEQWDADK